jgi:putative toxin-antitoxin system antitoxin component (TIGR02293 family)
MFMELKAMVSALGGTKALHRRVPDLGTLDRLVQEGLPYESFEAAIAALPPRIGPLVEGLVAPRTTRLRRRREGALPAEEGQRLTRSIRIWKLAQHVWESPSEAERFMLEPHPQLDHQAPIELLRSELGARRVEDLLMKLEYSLPV